MSGWRNPAMDDRSAPRKKKLGCLPYCGGSCFGFLVLFAIVFAVAYNRAGIYRPHIPPPKPLPVPNAYDDYLKAAQMISSSGGTKAMYASPASSSSLSLPGARQVVAANRKALATVRAAFAKESRNPPDRDIMAQSFRQMAGMREIARLLMAEAHVRAADGDHAGAFESGLDAMEMGEDLHRGGVLIHSLVALAVQAIGQTPMLDALERIPQNRVEPFVRRLERILISEAAIREVMEEERNLALTSYLETDNMRAAPFSTAANQLRWYEAAVGGLWWHFMREPTIRETDDYYRAALPQIDKPANARKMPPQPRGPISSMMVPVVEQGLKKVESHRARNRIFLCALALRGYRLKHGRLPDTLEELKLDARAITDPYSGRPLIYRKDGDGYLLYSLGPDLRDDDGIPADESADPMMGDLGIRAFRTLQPGSQSSRYYRKVPHMRQPKLPAGAPPLNK